MNGLNCPNCGELVDTEKASGYGGACWFGGEKNQATIFCCPKCFAIAQRLYETARGELLSLLNMLKESIRIALAEGRLQYTDGSESQISKRDLLEAIIQLQEKKDAKRPGPGLGDSADQPQASGRSTKPVRHLGD